MDWEYWNEIELEEYDDDENNEEKINEELEDIFEMKMQTATNIFHSLKNYCNYHCLNLLNDTENKCITDLHLLL